MFQVKIWFQNRRTKWKKQDNISNAEAAEHKNQTTGKQSGKTNSKIVETKSEGAINLVKTETNKVDGKTISKEVNGENGVNLIKHVTENVVNLTKQRNSIMKNSLEVIKIPSGDNCLVNSLLKEATSPNSIEDHSNTSLFTPDGSVSESCYSEAASTDIRVPLIGMPLALGDANMKMDASRSPPCDNNSQSQLSPGDDHLVIAETDDLVDANS